MLNHLWPLFRDTCLLEWYLQSYQTESFYRLGNRIFLGAARGLTHFNMNRVTADFQALVISILLYVLPQSGLRLEL